ncbi:MAG: ABC transporter permease [Bacteroidota bacterium]
MKKPPVFVSWLLKKMINPHLYDGIYGDLLQGYYQDLKRMPPWRASLHFLVSGLGFMRFPILMTKNKNESIQVIMLKNYFKLSLRNLRRNKMYALMSITGLIVSFVAFISIMQYVAYEKSYDNFHHQPENLYRISHKMTTSSSTSFSAPTFYGVKEDLEKEIPEITQSAQVFSANSATLNKDDHQVMEEEVLFISPEFFDTFHFEILEGKAGSDMGPNAVFLPATTAKKLFPDGGALGQTIEVSGVLGQTWTAQIALIFEDLPLRTHIRSGMMVPIRKLLNIAEEANFFGPGLTIDQVRWRWLSFHTYVRLEPGADRQEVEAKANQVVDKFRLDIDKRLNQNHDIFLQPVTDIHTTAGIETELSPVNDLKVIQLFSLVAVCILIIGWINYVNMSTAHSAGRSKEVGVRKVLGSRIFQLRTQFQVEALVMNLLSFLLSFLIIILVAPYLEDIVGIRFFETFFKNNGLMVGMVAIVGVGSYFSSLYPAHVLSGYRSVEVLKGKLKHSSKGVLLRRFLVGVQFVFTIFLMSGLIIIHRQMDYMMGHDLGINIDQTVLIELPANNNVTREQIGKMQSFKNELAQLAGIEDLAVGSLAPGIENNWRNSTENSDSEKAGIFIHRAMIDHNYFDLYEVPLLAGRMFDRSFSEADNIIINLNSSQKLGYLSPDDAINQDIIFAGQTFKIIGVVDDFYHRGVQFEVEPFSFNLDTALNGGYVSLKTHPANLSVSLGEMETVFKRFFPEAPFQSQIVKEVFLAQYENEKRLKVLFGLFTSIAVIIAVLGLAGLASFILNQRVKEVCVRKVLGAKTQKLFFLLNKEYVVICFMAFIITVPIAVYLATNWLNGFENRIALSPFYFILPFLLVLLIVLLATVGYTWEVIHANPSVILKEES